MEKETSVRERIEALVERGWTKKAIADEMGVEYGTLLRWTDGRRAPRTPGSYHKLLDLLEKQKPPRK